MKPATPKPSSLRCWSGFFGCGQPIEKEFYNFTVRACRSCCEAEARKWRISIANLDFLPAASKHPEGIEAALTKMGVERVRWAPPAPMRAVPASQMPLGDQGEGW